jgi:prepilin-type N-terminal cleavage/methylation domain-containing protein
MKHGLTLIESMIALSVTGAVAGVAINEISEGNKESYGKKIVVDIEEILSAVNHRIAIDGYDPDLWSDTSWSSRDEIRNKLISEELNTIDSICPDGKWNPMDTANDNVIFLNCNLYKYPSKIGVSMSAEMSVDPTGFIDAFNIYFSFENDNDFQSYFKGLKKGISEINLSKSKEISGSHIYSFVDKTNRNTMLTTVECISNPSNCELKASYSRVGGGEYIRADGSNSMIGSNLTFIETKSSSAPLKCLRWSNEIDSNRYNTGVWKIAETECGVGIYKSSDNKDEIALVADTGTFKNILLDKSCNRYNWSSGDVLEISSSDPSPCGMSLDGGEIYQVVDNTESTRALIKYLKTSEIGAKEILTKDLIAEEITVDVITSLNELNFESIAHFKKEVNFEDEVNFKDNTVFDKELLIEETGKLINKGETELANVLIGESLEVTGETLIKDNLSVIGSVSLTNNLSVGENTTTKSLNVKDNAVVSGNITSSSMTANVGSFNNIDKEIKDIKAEIAFIANEVKNTAPATPKSVWKKVRTYTIKDEGCKYSRPNCSVSNTSSVSTNQSCGSIGLRTNVTSGYKTRQWRSSGETCRSCQVTVTEMLCTNP